MTIEQINEFNNLILDSLEDLGLIVQDFENEDILSLKIEIKINELPKIEMIKGIKKED